MIGELGRGFGILLIYYICALFGALILRRFVKMPSEVFRKILHTILLGSIFIWIYAFERWWVSAVSAGIFAAVIFPLLAIAERFPGYSKILTERRRGELKMSLVVVSFMIALMISICWGVFDRKYLATAAILAWGLGDAAAALVGKRFGRRFITGRLVEGKKSVEGSVAMFCVSFVAVAAVLIFGSPIAWYFCLLAAALTAAGTTAVELYTKSGMDTLTCPLAAAAVLIPIIYFLGG